MIRARRMVRAVACCAAGIAAQPAFAADVSAGEDDVIVVTAQRRPEAARDVPIFLTVRSGDELLRVGASDMPSLGKVVPSLVMTRSGAFTQPYLRGVGKRSTLGVENSVATYVDGVYLASSIGALLDLRGIERVEVLNGPQGTLFGRNTTGGVIQIVTRDPESGMHGEAEVGAGSYGYARGDLYVTGGSDRVAGNLALSFSRSGGYGRNFFSGRHDQGEIGHSIVARSKWVWRPAAPTKVTLAADYQDIDQDFSQKPVLGFPAAGEPRVIGFRDYDQDASNRFRPRYGGISTRIDTEIGRLNFVSLSALRRMRARYGADLDQGPARLLEATVVAKQKQFSQEFQLQSNENSRVRWLAGLYYIHIEERYDPTVFLYGGSYSARLGGRVRQTLFDVGDVSSYAAFADATWPVGRRTRLTGGLRYTIEQRSVQARGEQLYDNAPFVRPIPGLPLLSQEPLRNRDSFRELTWRASVDHHFADGLMAYVSATRGFQSGGWNLQTPQNPPFATEKLEALEGGVKLAEPSGHLKARASAFYYDYSDLQISAFTPAGSITTNAASANIYGLDLAIDATLGAATRLRLGAQLLHAQYNHFPNATCTDFGTMKPVPYAPMLCDVTGNRLPFAPKLKGNIGGDHQISLGAIGTLLLSANLAYNSGYYSEPDNFVRQDAFATLDASAEWRLASGRPAIRLWALNLTNSHYYDSLVTFPTTGVLQRPAAPRRFGISIASTF